MKRTDIFIISLIVSFLMTSCGKEEPFSPASGATPVELRVVADNFVSTGGTSRATEEGYTTKFAAEDQIGIFAVTADGKIVDKNIPYKYNGSTWVPADAANTVHQYDNYLDGVTYFAYYPYSAEMDDAVSENDIVVKFTPRSVQSTYADYTGSDLMTGAGTLSTTGEPRTLTFQLKHRMALLVLCPDPYVTYVVPYNADYEYYARGKGTITNAKINNTSAYAVGDDTYRLIVKPATMDVPLEYRLGANIIDYTFTSLTLTAGTYRKFKLGHPELTVERAMQVGDYYYNNGKLMPGADGEEPVDKEKCIGVVFHVGVGPGDNWSNYVGSGLVMGKNIIRGYVVALTDRRGDPYAGEPISFKWADSQNLIGTSTSTTDFKGYANASLILQKATNPVTAQMSKDYSCPHGAPPANSSGWYLASVGQMLRIEENRVAKLTPSLLKAGGMDFSGPYWTSTEYSVNDAYLFVMGNSNSQYYLLPVGKRSETSTALRPVLTF